MGGDAKGAAMSATGTTADLTPEQMQALIEADRQRRIQLAGDAIKAALELHRCDLLPVPQLTPDGRIVAVLQISAR